MKNKFNLNDVVEFTDDNGYINIGEIYEVIHRLLDGDKYYCYKITNGKGFIDQGGISALYSKKEL